MKNYGFNCVTEDTQTQEKEGWGSSIISAFGGMLLVYSIAQTATLAINREVSYKQFVYEYDMFKSSSTTEEAIEHARKAHAHYITMGFIAGVVWRKEIEEIKKVLGY